MAWLEQHPFLEVLETEKPEITVPVNLVPDEDLLPGL